MSSPIGATQGAGGVGSVDSQMDLQTLMFTVMAQRSMIIDEQVRGQASKIQGSNDTLKDISKFMSEATVNKQSAQNVEGVDALSATEANGKISIDIGDNYTLEIPKPNTSQEWTLTDKSTTPPSSIRVWGDPHVDERATGKADSNNSDWMFKEQTSFVLKDGTKITVGTTPWGNNENVTASLTITRGDESVVVKGINDNKVTYTQSESGGRALDASTNDGTVVYQGDGGVASWKTGTGSRVTGNNVASTVVTSEAATEANDIEMSPELKSFLAAHPDIKYNDSDGDGKLTRDEYDVLMSSMKSAMDSMTSSSQLDMTMLQSSMNKYNQTFEALSNFISKYSQSLNTITGNLR